MEDNLNFEFIVIFCFIIALCGTIWIITDKDGIFNISDANWWTKVLCDNGEINDNLIYDSCVNETGEYKAKFYGKKYYGNRTSSWSPYWHMKQYSHTVHKAKRGEE